MSRPIWRGSISFGLVNIPVQLYSAEKKSETIHFHLLDKKNHTRIQNQRINKATGKIVNWNDIEKAYEFEKGKYVAVDQNKLEKMAAKNYETIEIMDFVLSSQVDPIFFEKPYYLIPNESGFKGYILLQEILKETGKIGIAKIVIKTREHLAAIISIHNFLALITLRYAKELKDIKEFSESFANLKKIKITQKEKDLAEKLVNSMTAKWDANKYPDQGKELLMKLIKDSIKKGHLLTDESKTLMPSKHDKYKGVSSEKVVDFMALLKKSLDEKQHHEPTPPNHTTGRRKKHA